MKVFVVLCRIDGQQEYDRVYATEHGARAYCQQQNAKPVYYGRFTFHETKVLEEPAFTPAKESNHG